jgi:antitoxin ChpS
MGVYTTNLRKVGGSVMMAIPPALLELLDLQVGAVVAVEMDGQRLVIEPQRRPKYSLDELLAQCNPNARRTKEEKEWDDAPSVGKEL